MATMSNTRETVGAFATAAALIRGLVATGMRPPAPVSGVRRSGSGATSVSARLSALPNTMLVLLPPMAR